MADTSLVFNIIAKDKASGTFDKIKGAAMVAGAAIGAVLIAGVGQAIEKSKLDQKLSAQLGATPAQAKMIGKLSGKVYADGFGEDLASVNAAIKAVAQNGLVDIKTASAETAAAATKNLLTVGSVLEEDSERVSSAVSQMMRTGLAKSSEEAMDLLVKATQNGVNKSQDLLDTANEYGTQFRKLGLDGPRAFGLLSQAIKAGARDSDTAADALKEFSIRAIDGSKASSKAYATLGIDAGKMTAQMAKGGSGAAAGLDEVLTKLKGIKDPVKQNAAAVGLFGTKAEDLGKALFSMDLKTASKEMTGLKGATAGAAATAGAGAVSLDTFKRQIQMGLVAQLTKAIPAIQATFGWLQKNQAWVTPLAYGLGIVGIAIGIVTAAQWAWNAALLLSPVTWIIIGIVALVAIIVLVATKTRFFQTLWGAVWGFMKGVGAWFAGPFAGFFVSAWRKIIAHFMLVKNSIMAGVNAIKRKFNDWVQANSIAAKQVIGAITRVVNYVRAAPGRMRSALSNMFAPMYNGFRGYINRIIGGWNRLSFGIPGFSFAGISVPGMSVGTPDIPYLDTGGTIRRDGVAFVHKGEKVIPKAQVHRTGQGKGGGGSTLVLQSDGTKLSRLLLELVRETIRDKGGDPVKVLTPR